MNKNNKSKRKTKEKEINEVLIDLENDLNNFKLNIDQKDKKIKEYIKLLELAKKEYQKVTHENNQLKQQILGLRKAYQNKKQIKRNYVIEQPEIELSSEESAGEEEKEEYPEIKQKKNKNKRNRKTNKKIKRKN